MFNPGDRVRHKHLVLHEGVVIHQTGKRVGWSCLTCDEEWCDDLAEDLELIE